MEPMVKKNEKIIKQNRQRNILHCNYCCCNNRNTLHAMAVQTRNILLNLKIKRGKNER
jgi:hypothetical protein